MICWLKYRWYAVCRAVFKISLFSGIRCSVGIQWRIMMTVRRITVFIRWREEVRRYREMPLWLKSHCIMWPYEIFPWQSFPVCAARYIVIANESLSQLCVSSFSRRKRINGGENIHGESGGSSAGKLSIESQRMRKQLPAGWKYAAQRRLLCLAAAYAGWLWLLQLKTNIGQLRGGAAPVTNKRWLAAAL